EFLNAYSTNPGSRIPGAIAVSARESWTYKLSDEDLKFVNDTRLAALLLIQDGTYRQGDRVRKVQTLYPIPKVLYDFYRDMPLPRRPIPQTPERASTADAGPVATSPLPPAAPRSEQAAALHTRMEGVWQTMEREEATGRG